MGWFSDSKEDGMKDGEKGRSDPIREFFDKDYKKGVDIGKGISDGEKAHRELDKHPISGPVVDAFLGGFDTMGKSKDYGRTYNRVKHGESPRKVFGDEIRKSEKATRKEHTRTDESFHRESSSSYDYEDRHYHGCDYQLSIGTKWFIGLVALVFFGAISSPFLNYTIKRHFPSREVKQAWNLEYIARYGGWERHLAADKIKNLGKKYDNNPYIKYVKQKREKELTRLWNSEATLKYLSQFKEPETRKKAEQWLITYYDARYGANCKDLSPAARLRCFAATNELRFQGKTKPSGVMY